MNWEKIEERCLLALDQKTTEGTRANLWLEKVEGRPLWQWATTWILRRALGDIDNGSAPEDRDLWAARLTIEDPEDLEDEAEVYERTGYFLPDYVTPRDERMRRRVGVPAPEETSDGGP